MKKLITNINSINAISGSNGKCGCSNHSGSDRSDIHELTNQEACKHACCSIGWEMAHFIAEWAADKTQQPISMFCPEIDLNPNLINTPCRARFFTKEY